LTDRTARALLAVGVWAYSLDGLLDSEGLWGGAVSGADALLGIARMAAVLADAGVVALVAGDADADGYVARAREVHRRGGQAFFEARLAHQPVAGGCDPPELVVPPGNLACAVDAVVSALHASFVTEPPASSRYRPPHLADPDPDVRLTARERSVLTLMSLGMTNKEIADQLGIRLPTVKNHVHHILQKLRVTNRGRATAVARGDDPLAGLPGAVLRVPGPASSVPLSGGVNRPGFLGG
jgi:DNA-binding NarL/FixJ family response regulator